MTMGVLVVVMILLSFNEQRYMLLSLQLLLCCGFEFLWKLQRYFRFFSWSSLHTIYTYLTVVPSTIVRARVLRSGDNRHAANDRWLRCATTRSNYGTVRYCVCDIIFRFRI